MMPWVRRAGLLAVLATAACQSPLSRVESETDLAQSGRYRMLPHVRVPEAPDRWGCGAQALAAVIAYHDPAVDPQRLADSFPWKAKGATPVAILLGARTHGYRAEVLRGTLKDIESALDAKAPPLVMFESSVHRPPPFNLVKGPLLYHWAIVVGSSRDGKELLLGAPHGNAYVVTKGLFLERWDAADDCLVAVRPAKPVAGSPASLP